MESDRVFNDGHGRLVGGVGEAPAARCGVSQFRWRLRQMGIWPIVGARLVGHPAPVRSPTRSAAMRSRRSINQPIRQTLPLRPWAVMRMPLDGVLAIVR